MKRKHLAAGVIAAVALTMGVALTQGRAESGPPGERPELARRGAFGVGTVVRAFALPPRVRITTVSAVTGSLPTEPRSLKVRFWYPAQVAERAPRVRYTHDVTLPGKPVFVWSTQGIAADGALVVPGKRYPLILFSHGYGAWSEYASNLAEGLAAKGYVVAAIDHADMPFDSMRTFLLSFGNVLIDRARDQREVLGLILKQAASEKTGFASVIDADKVGLMAHSMGGYGAFATAGAPYDPGSKVISQLPAAAQKAVLQTEPAITSRIKALVAISPWGGQPDNRVWAADGLAQVKIPVLMIAGDQDDVVNFKQGVSWVFDNLKGTDRSLLVYREARHNIVGNPVRLNDESDFQMFEFFAEPVWQTERLNMINLHFITAFFDLTLKGDQSKAPYLDVSTQVANDGDWPIAPGQQLGGKMAGAEQQKYWRGFQRRWAVGLEMRRAERNK